MHKNIQTTTTLASLQQLIAANENEISLGIRLFIQLQYILKVSHVAVKMNKAIV